MRNWSDREDIKHGRSIFGVCTAIFLLAALSVASIDTASAIGVVSEKRLTFDAYKDRQPAWSPDGQWIAFATTRAGGWAIYKMKSDGSSITKLHHSGSSLEPSWAPMSRILFSIAKYKNEDVYMMNNDGTGVTRLTFNPVTDSLGNFDEYPSWNPSGTKIVWSSACTTSSSSACTQVSSTGEPKRLWIMNSDGSNKYKLNNIYGIQPTWSPDGTKIAFKSYAGGHGNIFVMNSDGTNPIQITFDNTNTHDPDWSPDSKYITYASNQDGDWEIYVIKPDGTGKQKLTNNVGIEDNFPAWSRDGKYIAYASDRTGNQEIWVMQIDYNAGPGPIPDPTPTPTPPPPPPTTNLVLNPGFETDNEGDLKPDSWYTNVYGGSTAKIAFTWTADYKYAGTKSAKIVSTDSYGKGRWMTGRNIPVTPGTNYNFGGYIKTNSAGKAYICTSFWNNALSYVSIKCTGSKSGTTDWSLVQGNIAAPNGAAYARVEFRTEGTGSAWFDDAILKAS